MRANLVLQCRHVETGELAVVKAARAASRAHRELLRSEVAIMRRLARANVQGVVHILDHGLNEPLPWYAMELVAGVSLRRFHRDLWERLLGPGGNTGVTSTVGLDEPTSPDESTPEPPANVPAWVAATSDPPVLPAGAGHIDLIARVIRELADALDQVHAQGVVHGDVTPDNVILRGGREPILIDFDASLVTVEPGAARELPFGDRAGRGTPSYIAPEVIAGDIVDARCDLYALGCILYELLTGQRPFSGSRKEDVLQQQLTRTPPLLESLVCGVPAVLGELVRGLLVKDPAERIGSAEDVSRVLSTWLGEARASSSSSRRAPLYRPRLRGRDAEIAVLRAGVDALAAGRGGFLLLEAMPGMGKTRLMNETASYAHRARASVRWCRPVRTAPTPELREAIQGSGLALFGPAIEFAKDRLLTISQEAENHANFERLRRYAAEILGAPRLHDRGAVTDPELEKREAQKALFDVLARSSEREPLVLLIDDLHLADELSLAFLVRFAEELAHARVLVIANANIEEAPAAFESLRTKTSARLELRPLVLAETRGVVRDLLGVRTLPDGLAEFVHDRSEGNPFWMAEYLDTAIQKSYLQRSADGSWLFSLARSTEEPAPVPSSIEELLTERVRRLSETGRHALEVASVLGRDFDAELVARLIDSEDDARDGIEELVALRVLARHGRELTFCHHLLQELEERALEPSRRRALHRRAASLLESSDGAEDQKTLARVGYHWSGAGEPMRALAYLERAAERARDTHALARAATLFRSCLRELERIRDEPGAAHRVVTLCEVLSDVLVAQALHGEARIHLNRAIAALSGDDAPTRARLHRKLATTHWTVHEYDAAAEQLRRAEVALGTPSGEGTPEYWTELIQIRLGRFEQLYFAGRTGPELDGLVDDLSPLIEHRGNEHQRCVYYFIAASNLLLRKRYAYDEQALALARKGLEAASTLPLHRRALARFMVGFTRVFGTRDACELAEGDFNAALEDVGKIEQATLKSRITTYRAVAVLRLGRVEATERAAEIALETAETARLPPYIGAAQVCLAWAAWHKGDTRRAEDLLAKARKIWKAHPHKLPVQNLAVFVELAMASARDDFETSKALLAELQSGLPALPEALTVLVGAAAHALESGAPREITLTLQRLLAEARLAGYA